MFDRERTRMLAVASAALLLSVLVWFNYSAVLPLVVADWGLSGTRAGIVFGAFQAGYLLAIVPAGVLVDRHSPRYVIAAGATVAGLLSLGFALLADDFLAGTLLRFVAGTGMAGVYVPGMRFVTDWYGTADRGTAMGLYVGTFSLGSGLSFLLASSIAAAIGWRVAIGATSVGALLVAPLILGVGRDAPGTDTRTSDGFDLDVLRNRAYLAAVGGLGTPEAVAGILAGVMIMLGGVGNALGGTLSDRIGRTTVIAIALVCSGLVSAVIGVLGGLPLPVLLVVVLVWGVALTMDSAPTSTAITGIVNDERVGTALSIQSFIGFTTTVVSPIVFGAALDLGGFALAFPTLAAGALVALGSLAVLRYAEKRRSVERSV